MLPDTEYKAETAVTASNVLPFYLRTTYNRHGVRIVFSQSGRIGVFDLGVSRPITAICRTRAPTAPSRCTTARCRRC